MFPRWNSPYKQCDSIRDLVQLCSIHTLKIRLEIPIAYLFYSYNKFWQLPWQLSSSFRAKVFAFFVFFLAFFFLFLWRFFFYEFAFTSAGVNPGTADQFSTCLSAICQVFLLWTRALKQKKAIVFLFFSLSSSAEAVIAYLTAPLLFSGTSVWTKAQECWTSDTTLPQAATGWGSEFLMGCGPMWSQGSEFMSGSWRKRPSGRPPRCIWPVTLAETLTHLVT